MDARNTERELAQKSENLSALRREIEKVIVGRSCIIERFLIGLLRNHHLLISGLAGSAKTASVKPYARANDTTFNRIQVALDLRPTDIIGTLIYRSSGATSSPRAVLGARHPESDRSIGSSRPVTAPGGQKTRLSPRSGRSTP